MRRAGFDELELYGADPAVVHVGRCHAMGPGFRVCHGYVADAVDGEAIVEAAVVAQDTAVAVGGIFAEADVGDDEEGGEAGAEETDGLNDWTLGVIGCGTKGVFDIWCDGNTEEDHGTEAFPYQGFEVRDEFVDAAAVLVGKGRDEGLLFSLIGYEEGVNQHRLCMLAKGWYQGDKDVVLWSIVARPAMIARADDYNRHEVGLRLLQRC